MASGGYIEIIFGPMFSSKTVELITNYNKYSVTSKKCFYINSIKDTRSESLVSSNTKTKFDIPEEFVGCKTKYLRDVDVDDYDIIFVDEGQFYEDLVETVRSWAEKKSKCVFVAGLIATSEREQFGQLLTLFLYASKVTHTTAICLDCISETDATHVCDKFPAAFTSALEAKTGKELIGSSDKYKSTCQHHYLVNLSKA